MASTKKFKGLEIAQLVRKKLEHESLQEIAHFFEAQISDTATIEDLKKLSVISVKKRTQIECAALGYLYVNSLIGLGEPDDHPLSASLLNQMKSDGYCVGFYDGNYYIAFESVDAASKCLDKEINAMLIDEYQRQLGGSTLTHIYTSSEKIKQFNSDIDGFHSEREYVTTHSPAFSELLISCIEADSFQMKFECDTRLLTAKPLFLIDGAYTSVDLDDTGYQAIYHDLHQLSTRVDSKAERNKKPIRGHVFIIIEDVEYKLKINAVHLDNCILYKCLLESDFDIFHPSDRVESSASINLTDLNNGKGSLFKTSLVDNEQALNLSIISVLSELAKESQQAVIIDKEAQELINENTSQCKVATINNLGVESLLAINPLAVYLGNLNTTIKRNLFVELESAGVAVIGFCPESTSQLIAKTCANTINVF